MFSKLSYRKFLVQYHRYLRFVFCVYCLSVITSGTKVVSFALSNARSLNGAARKNSFVDSLVLKSFLKNNYTRAHDVIEASAGIHVWRQTMLRGRLPVREDFDSPWPREPLLSSLSKVMASLQLPRFVRMHPKIIDAVLIAVFRTAIEFQEQREIVFAGENDEPHSFKNLETNRDVSVINEQVETIATEQINRAAEDISMEFLGQFEMVMAGVNSLDRLFGPEHDLLQFDDDIEGFGLQDGIWKHSGWQILPPLQRELQSMRELRDLVKDIGRRPTVEKKKGRLQKFEPRNQDSKGSMGAEFDPYSLASVNDLTFSDNLAQMLSSEAVLLRGSPIFRRLFMAKKIESKLLSYQLSDWRDILSVPKKNPKHFPRLPSGLGGPIIVCLDTSWSMSGRRETLSKAVVLACVSSAHKQGRDCQVVSFSNERGVMDSGKINADSSGIRYLLEFLSNSFGGGTDVTGALKHAISSLGKNMSAADIMLVTDGEIPDPPISEDIMANLDSLKIQTGMQIHGLLVGKRQSKPLSSLCTYVYDFLIDYENSSLVSHPVSSSSVSNSMLLASRPFKGENRLSRTSRNVGNYGWRSFKHRQQNFFSSYPLCAKRIYEDESDETLVVNVAGDYIRGAQQATEIVLDAVTNINKESIWQTSILDDEKNVKESCWCNRAYFRSAVEQVSENLVERGGESRLLVLAMLAEEHILFLGAPGTAKSELGRRLSKLCGGLFFQRLLTRFTTPEEIFGPLSLQALETDEYKRCTNGYLPTSSIAFLDEIFKANSAILNTLLTILNERQFDNGAGEREFCPIRCVVGASNELPESDELEALYDRFLLRKEVLPVSDEGLMHLLGMLNPGVSGCRTESSNSDDECEIPFAEGLDNVIQALAAAAESVTIRDDICALLRDLRTFMKEELDVDVSDRRLTKAARLLKISAASNGRTSVDRIDCMLLQHIVWRFPEQRHAVREWLLDTITPFTSDEGSSSDAMQFQLILDGLRREAMELVRKTGGDISGKGGARAVDVELIKALRNEVANISCTLREMSDLLARHKELLKRATEYLWLPQDELLSLQQLLLPKTELVAKEVDKVLNDSLAIELALSSGSGSPSDNVRLSVLELLQTNEEPEIYFTEAELKIGAKEAKVKYDKATFRKWKRARKKAEKK